ncbi:MAG: hypothetical protein WDA09_04130 [Bacteriovoracaceae bacterium]
MFKIISLLLLISCAHQGTRKKNFVTVDTALFQARSSYLLGCTEALVEQNKKGAFEHCSHKAQKHLEDLEGIMNQELK